MKQINVVKERCIGCGACVAIDPEHFEFDDEGKSSIITNENLDTEEVTNAIESCPTAAIEIKENDENSNCTCENCDCESQKEDRHQECHCHECDCEEEKDTSN